MHSFRVRVNTIAVPHLPSCDDNSSEGSGPPGLVGHSDSDDQADEQIRRPVVLTDSETDSDSDSDTAVMPVRNPDGSVELRQLPIAFIRFLS